jgi:hypothetical protein
MYMKTHSRLVTATAILTLSLALAIGVLTLTHSASTDFPGSDKLHHMLAFAALALPISFARPRLAIWVSLAAIAYGGLIEVIQPIVGRDGDILDLLYDAAGSALGASIGVSLRLIVERFL